MVAFKRQLSLKTFMFGIGCIAVCIGITSKVVRWPLRRLLDRQELYAMGATSVQFDMKGNVVSVAFTNSSVQLNGIERFSKIREIGLSNSSVKGDQLMALSSLEELEVLDLSHTLTTDEDLQILKAIPNLTYLRIDNTLISDAAFGQLSKYPCLKGVDVTATLISKDAIVQFQSLHPQVGVTCLLK